MTGNLTNDLSWEGAAGDVLVGELDNNVILSWSGGEVGDAAGTVLVVYTLDLSLGWTLNGKGKTTYEKQPQNELMLWYQALQTYLLYYKSSWIKITRG